MKLNLGRGGLSKNMALGNISSIFVPLSTAQPKIWFCKFKSDNHNSSSHNQPEMCLAEALISKTHNVKFREQGEVEKIPKNY